MIDQEFIKIFIFQLQDSIRIFMPETALVVTFILALMFDVVFRKYRSIAGVIAILGFIATGILLVIQPVINDNGFAKLISIDPMSQFFKWIILMTSFIIVVLSFFSKELYDDKARTMGEYYSLIVGMTFGMFILSGASNMLMIYISIEIMSLTSYVLAGYTKEIRRASEASLKYVIYGAISSGLMIYGISILYGLTGTLNLFEINTYMVAHPVNVYALIIAVLMIIAGFGYKISAVPFHFWTPDVYEGAPVTITAFLSVASKAAGFAVLIRFIKIGFSQLTPGFETSVWVMLGGIDWQYIVAILAVLTMTLGNLVAVWQTNMKRLLAYSSIAHAGYILLGVVVMTNAGLSAVMIYFFVYMFMNLGAFFVVLLIANKIGSEEIDDYTGLGYRSPLLSVCMVLFLISLTGLPPTAGFIGKLYIFTALLESDKFLWLAVIGVLNSVVSLFYYAKVIRNMYLRGIDNANEPIQFSAPALIVLLLLAAPTLYFGMFFNPIVEWARSSAAMFLGN